jgi:pimeloyl-ACP methyl ester carboxylesterase
MRPTLALAFLITLVMTVAPAPAPAQDAPTAATAPTRVVRAGGTELAYRSIGTGRPLVLVMGLSGTMDAWDPALVDALARGGRRVVLLDNRGMGRSRLGSATVTIRRMADDAAALIRRLRLGRPDVLGYSMGGMIVQSLAVRYPSRVRRVVLCATAPGDGRATPPTPAALEALASPDSALGSLRFLFPPGAEAARDRYVARLARRRSPRPVGPRDVVRQQLAASATWLAGQDPAGRRVNRLRAPVLVAGGTLDELLPYPNQQHLARAIPRARLVTYRGASHGVPFGDPLGFAARVERFLLHGAYPRPGRRRAAGGAVVGDHRFAPWASRRAAGDRTTRTSALARAPTRPSSARSVTVMR